MKEAKLMRKNARSRWSWEPGGDLITLTVRVAGAAVVNVIGHSMYLEPELQAVLCLHIAGSPDRAVLPALRISLVLVAVAH
jgi:hypothetical protein